MRGSIRKQSRKTLTARRQLPRYQVLRSTKERFAPLPCICRLAAVLRCRAVLAEPSFSYVTRASCPAVSKKSVWDYVRPGEGHSVGGRFGGGPVFQHQGQGHRQTGGQAVQGDPFFPGMGQAAPHGADGVGRDAH